MFGLLATVSFVVAAVIFFMLAINEVDWEAAWGFFFIALGLALGGLGGAYAEVRSRSGR